jgi:hypothetical protein
MRILQIAVAISLFVAIQVQANTNWVITSDNWSRQNEQEYQKLVHDIGKMECSSLSECMTSSANPYYSDRQEDAFFSSVPFDCAKLPYILRSYFAWKNGLPFSYTSEISPIGNVGPSGDDRYSEYGNRITSREKISSGTNALSAMESIAETVSTAMFRVPPTLDSRDLYSDFYSVALNRDQIRPGTVLYDPNGHVAVVYSVEDDGRILFMDAHPDRSLTRGTYGQEFMRSRPAAGAGFKNWRPINYAVSPPQGSLNDEINGFSLEQFVGNRPSADGEWSNGQFVFNGRTLDYYEYLRNALASGQLRYNPVSEVSNMMKSICGDLNARVASVNSAIAAGMNNQSHPDRLPQNIYGTNGDWENYSSPSRDARLKAAFHELRQHAEHMIQLLSQHSPQIEYSGSVSSLSRELLNTYDREANACVISYTKSDGQSQSLNFEQVRQRLFDLSFDPYHCAELRWGASGNELNSCDSNQNKRQWYRAEIRLRNQIERDYNVPMGFSLDDLLSASPPKGSGIDQHVDVDTRGYLTRVK